MPRYLTPSKIALLALVSVYVDGAVPNPSIISVLSFLVSYLFLLDSRVPQPEPSIDKTHIIPIGDLEASLVRIPSCVPGRMLWDLFLAKIWKINCSDALDDFMMDMGKTLAKTREDQLEDRMNDVDPVPGKMLLSRTSLLGAFVRRCQLEWKKLQFHDTITLWKGLIKYRYPTFHTWAKRNPLEKHEMVDVNLLDLELDLSSPMTKVVYGGLEEGRDIEVGMSTKDMEQLLEFQISQMQSNGSRITDDIKERLEQMINWGSAIPSLQHYVKFLDSWKAGNYPSSFDHLHRYFDYTMQSRDRTFYQYALLNLAILQADFGCYSEAVTAIQEAITIARETHDMNCLTFCLSWLYHFGKAFPEQVKDVQNTGMLGSEKEGLMFLQAKARETGMWSLLSTSLLSEAKVELQDGSSVSAAFESLIKGFHLNMKLNLTTSFGPQFILQVALFNRIGASHLAWMSCEIFRECYQNREHGGVFEDTLHITQQSCQALAFRGFYSEAQHRLEKIWPSSIRSIQSHQYATAFSGILKIQRQLHRDNFVAIEHLLEQLKACPPPDAGLFLVIDFLEIEYLIRKGHLSAALSAISKRASSFRQENHDMAIYAKLLNLKSRVFQKSGQSERCLTFATRACSIALKAYNLPGLWESIGTIGQVLNSLKEFEGTITLLESIIPQILECGDSYLTAQTYSCLADANMGHAGKSRNDSVRQKEYMVRAVEYLDYSFEKYSDVEDLRGQCEAMAKKATVMHVSGDFLLANDYAAKYHDLKKDAAIERE